MNWLLLALVMVLVGCGSTTERTTRTVEREDLVAGPMVVDTPIGQFVMHPTRVTRFRTEDTEENARKTYEFPEAREIGGAMLGGLGGPLAGGGVVGLLAAWWMRRGSAKAAQERDELARERDTYQRRFGEVVEGVEHAKDRLDDAAWDKLTESLERKQSRDTMDAVRKKTS
jgi:hypothetical protein